MTVGSRSSLYLTALISGCSYCPRVEDVKVPGNKSNPSASDNIPLKADR